MGHPTKRIPRAKKSALSPFARRGFPISTINRTAAAVEALYSIGSGLGYVGPFAVTPDRQPPNLRLVEMDEDLLGYSEGHTNWLEKLARPISYARTVTGSVVSAEFATGTAGVNQLWVTNPYRDIEVLKGQRTLVWHHPGGAHAVTMPIAPCIKVFQALGALDASGVADAYLYNWSNAGYGSWAQDASAPMIKIRDSLVLFADYVTGGAMGFGIIRMATTVPFVLDILQIDCGS